MKLEIDNFSFGYNSSLIFNEMNFKIESRITVLIGPNAAGKSTLLKCIAGVLDPKGTIMFDGKDVKSFEKKDLIRLRSYLPQESKITSSLTVFEILLLGMANSLFWKVNETDLEVVSNVLKYLGIEDLALRGINELSGGQKQMVFIAQSLIRDPKLLLMDEPTNGLDLKYQLELFELIQKITLERGMTTIIALHDLNLAARFADNIVVMNKGEIYASGSPSSVLTQKTIESVYGINARISIDDDGVPWIKPINSIKNKW
ncbi:Iron(III) dicitrate transport ATP-binding protein FecE [Methanosarcina barkeri 3]|uniref:Cobalamin import ATP-binding protein BtuD n=1 Tax=Methanosarcina barkeri 3 TaxID=1434107 RepID=A0A0E3WXY4_METBA|nr:ABC transporter ATP-binding protein [Methanosarcina barkeri]AKB83825.1 Iron(III) dicitrate transport ATP-binding protein FecE [Methanosarcina barkeri 3]